MVNNVIITFTDKNNRLLLELTIVSNSLLQNKKQPQNKNQKGVVWKVSA